MILCTYHSGDRMPRFFMDPGFLRSTGEKRSPRRGLRWVRRRGNPNPPYDTPEGRIADV